MKFNCPESICKSCAKRTSDGFCARPDRIRAGFCGYDGKYADYEPTAPTIDREKKIEEYYDFQKSLDFLDEC